MHRTYREIGHDLSLIWGRDDSGSLTSFIKNLPADERSISLLAAAVDLLRDANCKMQSINTHLSQIRDEAKSHYVADAMLFSIRAGSGDVDIISLIRESGSPLSVRARRILNRSGIRFLSEVTTEKLMAVQGCGLTSANEIMAWTESLRHKALETAKADASAT